MGKAIFVEDVGTEEGFRHVYKVNGESVEIYPPCREFNAVRRYWTVTWAGAVDFEGNKRDLLKRYPEFRGLI